jgi:hypothetical protein
MGFSFSGLWVLAQKSDWDEGIRPVPQLPCKKRARALIDRFIFQARETNPPHPRLKVLPGDLFLNHLFCPQPHRMETSIPVFGREAGCGIGNTAEFRKSKRTLVGAAFDKAQAGSDVVFKALLVLGAPIYFY